jgi:hypothetical protein
VSPQWAAMKRMATTYAKPTVVAFTGTNRNATAVMAAMIPTTIAMRSANFVHHTELA